MTVYIRESKRNRSRHVPLDNTVYRAIRAMPRNIISSLGLTSISLFSVMIVNLLSNCQKAFYSLS